VGGGDHGRRGFQIPALPTAGAYVIRLAATDLAGNYNQIQGTVQATPQHAR
jgi:hypothetical protein